MPTIAAPTRDPVPLTRNGRSVTNEPFSLRVHVRHSTLHNSIVTECNHPLPVFANIVPFFEPATLRDSIQRRSGDYGYNNYRVDAIAERIIADGWCNCAQLQHAIASYLYNNFTRYPQGDPEPIVLTGNNTPAYLAVGGHLYRLQPTAEVATTRALMALRRCITAEAHAEAARLMAEADTNAAALTNEATHRLASAQAALEQATRGVRVPPQWAIHYPLQLVQGRWAIGMRCDILFTHLEYKWPVIVPGPGGRNIEVYKFKRWQLNEDAAPFRMLLWQPLDADGQLEVTRCIVDWASPLLPHINLGSACMGISDAPRAITDAEQMEAYIASVRRCMTVIDYTSPLTHATQWDKRIRDFIPRDLMRALLADHSHDRLISDDLPAEESGDYHPEAETFRAA